MVTWQNLDQDAEHIDVHVSVSADGNDWHQVRFDPAEVIYDTASDEKRSGSHTFTLSEMNLLEDSSYWGGQSPFAATDFAAASGETTSTTVYIRIEVLTNPISGTDATEITTFDVTVTNQGGGGVSAVITVDGDLNTRVEG